MILRSVTIAASFLFLTQNLFASDICESFKAPNKIQPQLSNCEKVVKSGLINRDALKYTVAFLNANHNKMQDSSCALEGKHAGDLCTTCNDDNFINKGIENNCSFVINDLKKPWSKPGEAYPGKSTGYFVNLCPQPGDKLVETFSINGSPGKIGDDRPTTAEGESSTSTLDGAFLMTNQITYDFVPHKNKDYENISKSFGGTLDHPKVPAIRMSGLNGWNNKTEFDKPMHVSVYDRGLGCVGVKRSTFPIMEKIVRGGRSSLYMAYNGRRSEQKDLLAHNDNQTGENKPSICRVPRDLRDPSGTPNLPSPSTKHHKHRAVASVVDPLNSRFVFDVSNAGGAIQKLQVDFVSERNLTIAKTKYLTAKGEKGDVQLVCQKIDDAFNCRRSDNGGSFDFYLEPQPSLNINYFSADSENSDDKSPLILRAKDHKTLIIDGKKATLTKADAF